MQYLSYVFGIGSLICWIMTLVQMFKREVWWKGLLGIICGLWAFIWGWMKVKETGQKTLMMVWTALIVVGMIFNFVLAGSMIAQNAQ